MTQMSHNIVAFKSAAPTRDHDPAAPSLMARLAAQVRRYLARRRTLRAFERLNEAQLKDIGFRRIPGNYTKYERIL